MTEEYKSIEQRIWESCRPFAESAIKTAYGLPISFFRVPTLVRKLKNRQSWIVGEEINKTPNASSYGGLLGISGVAAAVIYFGRNVVESTKNNDYFPVVALGAMVLVTNLASGVYEAIRAPKKENNLEKRAETAI